MTRSSSATTAVTVVLWVALWLISSPIVAQSRSTSADTGFRGCAVIDDGRLLADENADRLFVPASVIKIVVTAAAMHSLGPEYRATTRVVGGPIHEGTLRGDLVWIGGGDPTWNSRFFEQDPRAPIRRLIAQLKAAGLRHVSGDLVIDRSLFPGRPFPATRAINEIAFGFAAPTSALAVDENTIDFYIAPRKSLGAPGIARPKNPQAIPDGFDWLNQTTTVDRDRDGRGTVDFQPIWHSLTIRLRGEYPISEPSYTIGLAVPDGDLYAGQVILKELRKAGIRVDGEVDIGTSGSDAGARPLATLKSPPLIDWLSPILQDSLNWYADMLLRQLALAQTGEGRSDSGLDLLQAFLVETVGVAPGSFHLDDASGVSPYNLISPRTVARALDWALEQPWHEAWLRTFPDSKTGTLKVWPPLPGDSVAKTGTLRHTLGLAGYTRLPAGRPIVFTCFLGHRTDPRQAQRRELVAKVRALIGLS